MSGMLPGKNNGSGPPAPRQFSLSAKRFSWFSMSVPAPSKPFVSAKRSSSCSCRFPPPAFLPLSIHGGATGKSHLPSAGGGPFPNPFLPQRTQRTQRWGTEGCGKWIFLSSLRSLRSLRLKILPLPSRENFFQSLENCRKIFPIIGKIGPVFPTIGNFFSNRWKTGLRPMGQRIVRGGKGRRYRLARRMDSTSSRVSCL